MQWSIRRSPYCRNMRDSVLILDQSQNCQCRNEAWLQCWRNNKDKCEVPFLVGRRCHGKLPALKANPCKGMQVQWSTDFAHLSRWRLPTLCKRTSALPTRLCVQSNTQALHELERRLLGTLHAWHGASSRSSRTKARRRLVGISWSRFGEHSFEKSGFGQSKAIGTKSAGSKSI